MPIKYHISTDKQHYFTVNARNGQVIVTSETYKTKQGCAKGVKALFKVLSPTVNKDAKVGESIFNHPVTLIKMS